MRESENSRMTVRVRVGAGAWTVVPFSAMGESGRSLCVFGHVEEESSFLGMLSVR